MAKKTLRKMFMCICSLSLFKGRFHLSYVHTVLQITVFQLAGIYKTGQSFLCHAKGILKISLGSIRAVEWGWLVAPQNLVFLLCSWQYNYYK